MESSVLSKKVKDPPMPSASARRIRKMIRATWILFFCIITLPFLYVYSVSVDLLGLFGGMPAYTAVENPENDLSSDLISADGKS